MLDRHRLASGSVQAGLSRAGLALVIYFTILFAYTANSQTWSNAGIDNNWSTDANWIGNVAPVNDGSADVTFADASVFFPLSTVDLDYDVDSITFSPGIAVQFTFLDSTTLSVQGGDAVSIDLLNQSALEQILSGGAVELFDSVNSSGDFNLTNTQLTGGGTFILESGTVRTGTATNSFTGGLLLRGGTYSITGASALGDTSGTVTLDGGNLLISSPAASPGSTISLGRALDVGSNPGSSIEVAANTTAVADQSFTSTPGEEISKIGGGTLVVTSDNSASFGGELTINEGEVSVSSGGALGGTVTVEDQTVLSGGGSVNIVELNDGGVISPDDGEQLDLSELIWNNGGIVELDLDVDMPLNVGNLTRGDGVGRIFRLEGGDPFVEYTLLEFGLIDPSLSEDDFFVVGPDGVLTVDRLNNVIVFTIPEPGPMVLSGLLVLAVTAIWRRRRAS